MEPLRTTHRIFLDARSDLTPLQGKGCDYVFVDHPSFRRPKSLESLEIWKFSSKVSPNLGLCSRPGGLYHNLTDNQDSYGQWRQEKWKDMGIAPIRHFFTVKFGDDCGVSQQISSAGILRQPLQADSWNSHWKPFAFHITIIMNCWYRIRTRTIMNHLQSAIVVTHETCCGEIPPGHGNPLFLPLQTYHPQYSS